MSGQWLTRQTEDDTVHAVPLADAIVTNTPPTARAGRPCSRPGCHAAQPGRS